MAHARVVRHPGAAHRVVLAGRGRAPEQRAGYIFNIAVQMRSLPPQMPRLRPEVTTTAGAVVYHLAPLPRRAAGVQRPRSPTARE